MFDLKLRSQHESITLSFSSETNLMSIWCFYQLNTMVLYVKTVKKYPICITIEMLEPENQRLYLPETVTSETDACSRPLQSACQGKSDVSTSLISVISSC